MANKRLRDKCAIVTGAATGLGRGIAHRFVDEGATVIITDIDEATAIKTAAAINARFIPQDVTDEAQWTELFSQLDEDDIQVDILVNNAGFADAGLGVPLEDIDIMAARRVFEVNVEGTLIGCKHAVRHMKAHGGSIINMSSVGALVPVPFIAAYGASKAAVRHLTQSIALYCAEQGYAVRCNSIHPGQIRTTMHDQLVIATASAMDVSEEESEAGFLSRIPMGEFGQVEDVAAAALYLASDESRHVTGDRMLVDGGMMLSN
ncbi:MAG: glucose 1-dehydrogenase [Pseudomonadota bacterium]